MHVPCPTWNQKHYIVGARQQFLDLSMPTPPLLMMLSLLAKLAYKALKVVTIEKNEYKEYHGKSVTKQRQGSIVIKYGGGGQGCK